MIITISMFFYESNYSMFFFMVIKVFVHLTQFKYKCAKQKWLIDLYKIILYKNSYYHVIMPTKRDLENKTINNVVMY